MSIKLTEKQLDALEKRLWAIGEEIPYEKINLLFGDNKDLVLYGGPRYVAEVDSDIYRRIMRRA